MPTGVSFFVNQGRRSVAKCFDSHHQILKGGNTYNTTILSLHIENPQAPPQTCLSPPPRGLCSHVTSHDRSASPHYLCCRGTPELPAPPRHIREQLKTESESLAPAAVLGVLPHSLSMATAAPEKPVHLLRKWREATKVSSHNIPLFPPCWISFLKQQRCILLVHFTTPFPVFGKQRGAIRLQLHLWSPLQRWLGFWCAAWWARVSASSSWIWTF